MLAGGKNIDLGGNYDIDLPAVFVETTFMNIDGFKGWWVPPTADLHSCKDVNRKTIQNQKHTSFLKANYYLRVYNGPFRLA